jgi:hypothetical protein
MGYSGVIGMRPPKKKTKPKIKQIIKPDVSEWSLETFDEIKNVFNTYITNALNEVLTIAVKETANVCVESLYSDAPVSMVFEIPLSNYEDEPATWRVPLTDICDSILLEMEHDEEADATRIINAFRECADRLEVVQRNRKKN